MRSLVFLMLAFATTIQAQDLKDPRFKYENALKQHQTTGKPLVVVLGATWCGPCQLYKAEAVREMASEVMQGKAKYVLAVVDYDEQRELAEKVLGGDKFMLPYTAIYYSARTKLRKKHFYEKHSLEFIKLVLKDIESQR